MTDINKISIDEANKIVYIPSDSRYSVILFWKGLGYEIRFK